MPKLKTFGRVPSDRNCKYSDSAPTVSGRQLTIDLENRLKLTLPKRRCVRSHSTDKTRRTFPPYASSYRLRTRLPSTVASLTSMPSVIETIPAGVFPSTGTGLTLAIISPYCVLLFVDRPSVTKLPDLDHEYQIRGPVVFPM